MDLYSKYMLRASGEKKHQPCDATEHRVIAAVDTLKQFDWFKTTFSAMTDDEKRSLFAKLQDTDLRVTNRLAE